MLVAVVGRRLSGRLAGPGGSGNPSGRGTALPVDPGISVAMMAAFRTRAGVAELVDALDSKSSSGDRV